ncbi:hypothetical protein [Streptomyces goshikiensis]
MTDAGLLVRTEDGLLTLSGDVLYSLRLTDSDDTTAYWQTSWQNPLMF